MCSVDNTCSAMPYGSSKWAVPHFSLALRDIIRDAPSLTYPVNLVARYPRLICQDVANEPIVQWSFGWHLVEFWRVIFRIDVVPDTYKLAIAVVAAQ